MGAAIGSALSGAVTGLLLPSSTMGSANLIYGLTLGPYAGLYWGWIVAVATAITFRMANRDAVGPAADGPTSPSETAGVSPFGS